MTHSVAVPMTKPPTHVLFSSDLWKLALEKYAEATHTTVKLFDTDLRLVFGPIHPTPLFELFDRGGYDPGLFAECARRCLAQTTERPAVTVSKAYGLAAVGTSLVLGGKVVGAAVAGYVLVDFSQLSEIQRVAKDARIEFARVWQIAREQSPISQQRLNVNAELLQVLGDALLRENLRTRQYEHTALELQETGRAKENAYYELQQTASALRASEAQMEKELMITRRLQAASALIIEGAHSQHLYQKIVEAGVAIMGSDMASMQMLSPERGSGGELHLLAFHGFDPGAAKFWEWVRADSPTSCGAALRSGVRVVVADVQKCDFMAGTEDQSAYIRAGIRACQSTPLFSRAGHLLGMISTHWRTPHTPTEHEQRQFDVLARQAADLLEHEQTETALRASEERYHTLFDLGPVAVYSCDAAGVIRDYNHVAAELWGREPKPGDTDERWCGSFKMLRSDGTVMPHEQCPMAEVLSGKVSDVHDGEVQIERPDGSRITVLVNIRPLKNEQGEITGAINCFVDITERKQTEAVVRESEARFRMLADTIPQLAWMADPTGWIFWYNQGWYDYTGTTAKEMEGWGWQSVHDPEVLPKVLERWRESISTGKPFEMIFPLRGVNGVFRSFLTRVSPMLDADGKIVRWFGTNTDITEQRRAEQVLREAKRTLETRVKERTIELETLNAEVLAQSDQLQDLSLRLMRTQDEERRRISRELHDSLGQYLAHAKMSAHALKRPNATEKETENVQHLVDTLDKCLTETRTISHLLHPPLLDEVGLSSAAKWYIEGFSERSGIQANADIAEAPRRLSPALELALFRILQESLVNVHRHSHSQSVDIKLESTGHEVTLEVRDHGQGMPSGLLERLKSKDALGAGVGLRSMSGRIKEMGGSFEIESEKDGTLIRVTAPIPESPTKLESAPEKASAE